MSSGSSRASSRRLAVILAAFFASTIESIVAYSAGVGDPTPRTISKGIGAT